MPPVRFLLLCLLLFAALPARAEQVQPAGPTNKAPGGGAHAPPTALVHSKEAVPVVKARPLHPSAAQATPGKVSPGKSSPTKATLGKVSPGKVLPGKVAPAPVTPIPAPIPEAKPQSPAEPAKGSATGLPLPRFAALRSDDVNMRGGPGTRYPIDWVYKRRDLPVEIEREFEVWRLVQDQEGVKGWVHQATLTGRRSFVVTGAAQTMRRDADDGAPAVAVLKPGVIGRIRACGAGAAWCEVQVGEYRGWLQRGQFWGSYAGEAVSQ